MARTGKHAANGLSPAAFAAEAQAAGPVDFAAELAGLEELDLGQLRIQYRNRSGRIAPARISRTLLMRVLAYRVQADRFGDLRPDTRRVLERLGQRGAEDDPGSAAASIDRAGQLKPGTMLTREWQGRIEHVMVLGSGFAWNGSPYASLSAAALAITGTRWNGYRFFGLRSPGAGSAARSKSSPTTTGHPRRPVSDPAAEVRP